MSEEPPKAQHLVVIVRPNEPPTAVSPDSAAAADRGAAVAPDAAAASSGAAAAAAIDVMVGAKAAPPPQRRRLLRPLPRLEGPDAVDGAGDAGAGEDTTILGPPASTRVLALCGLSLLVLVVGLLVGGERAAAPGAPAADRVEAGWAYAWLDELQERYPYRARGSQAHRAAPAFVAAAMREAGLEDVRLVDAGHGFTNVLGVIPGRDRTQRVVLTAHVDVVGGAPGAIDDGGGIAAILAAARALTSAPEPPGCDVEVAIFDGEEIYALDGEETGCWGARDYLRRLAEEATPADVLRAVLAVELVGWSEDQLVVQTIPYGFAWDSPEGIAPAWLPQAVRVAGAEAGLRIGLGDPWLAPWYQGTIRVQKVNTGSDAGPFKEHGVPSCMLTGSALTNFYAGYHQPTDSMKRVDPARLDDAARAVAAAASELAARGPEQRPGGLGQVYFAVGTRTLTRLPLTLVGLLAGLAALAAAFGWRELDRTAAASLVGACGLALIGLSALGSVVGLVVGVPLCLGLAAASTQRTRWPLLFAGLIPLYVQALIVFVAGKVFGFAWRGGPLVLALLAVLVLSGLAARLAVGRLRRRRRPQPLP